MIGKPQAEHLEGDPDVVHRYVARTLTPAETNAFEVHLLACASCRDAVREGAAIRAALRAQADTGSDAVSPTRSRPRRLPWLFTAAAAAVLLFLVLARQEDPVRRLGRLRDMPAYSPLAVRAANTSTDIAIDSAMAAYVGRDYARVDRLLSEASRTRQSPAVFFYLGMARLAMDERARAIEALERSLEPAGNPYAAEARFYLGKAWLRLGQPDSAEAHLVAVPAGNTVHRAAAALMDSVRALRR